MLHTNQQCKFVEIHNYNSFFNTWTCIIYVFNWPRTTIIFVFESVPWLKKYVYYFLFPWLLWSDKSIMALYIRNSLKTELLMYLLNMLCFHQFIVSNFLKQNYWYICYICNVMHVLRNILMQLRPSSARLPCNQRFTVQTKFTLFFSSCITKGWLLWYQLWFTVHYFDKCHSFEICPF